jgi:FixJ family two-component response regulator
MSGNQSIVMIVDDDDSMRRAVRRLMKAYGFAVETFASAEEYLDSDRLAKTSCLVLDVNMPGMNGFELQKRLVALGSKIPIIFITALTDDSARVRAMNAGAVGYLAKPLDEEELLNCVDVALRKEHPSPVVSQSDRP